jgi:hypothetical protein
MRAEDRIAARLLEALEGLDLTSADGRAGIGTLLSEIERACPGAILQQAARIELRSVGWRPPSRLVPIVDVEPCAGRSALLPGV